MIYKYKFYINTKMYYIIICYNIYDLSAFSNGLESKELACKAGDTYLIPGLGRSPGGEHGHSHQYSCQENPMDRGASGLLSDTTEVTKHI